jgi:hypothetical protein
MARCAILAVATQPGPVEFLLPALTHALGILGEADVVLACDPAWMPDAARYEGSGVRFVALPPPGAVGELVSRLKPDTLVVSTAGSPVEVAALAAGTGAGVRCVQIVEVPYNHELRIRESAPAGFEADLVVTVSSADADVLTEAGVPRTRVSVVGHPGWERVAPEPAKNPAGAVFLSQPILDDGFDRFGYSEVTAWNLVLEARRFHPDRFESLVWAPHPRERRLDPLPDGCDALAADTPSALRENGIAFGIFSSILTTAYLTGRHVISVQPELPENDFCALSRMGWIHRCASVDDIIEALDARIEDAGGALRAQMRGSAQRLAAALAEQVRP